MSGGKFSKKAKPPVLIALSAAGLSYLSRHMRADLFIASRLTERGSKRFTTWILRLAVTAVAISVAVMILANCLIAGFKQEISRKIFDFWGHIYISPEAEDNTWDQSTLQYDSSLVKRLLEIRDEGASGRRANEAVVSHVQAVAQYPAIIQTRDELEGILLKGVGDDFRREFYDLYLVSGKPLSQAAQADSAREILLSQSTANRLNTTVGKRLRLVFVKDGAQKTRVFKVQGIYKTGLEEYDKKIAIVPISLIREVLDWPAEQIGAYEVFVSNIDEIDGVEAFIYEQVLPPELFSYTVRAKFPAIFDWLKIQDYNEIVILGLMAIVCMINMITVILILILERTRMIGILKSLGARNSLLRNLFLYYGGRILGRGLLYGNLIGLGLAASQYYWRWLHLPEEDYYLAYAPISFEWPMILAINGAIVLLVLLCLLLPLLILRRISPVRAIRFD